jgi:hypothetical protein
MPEFSGFSFKKYIQINTVIHSKLLHTVVKKLWQLEKKKSFFFTIFKNVKLRFILRKLQ